MFIKRFLSVYVVIIVLAFFVSGAFAKDPADQTDAKVKWIIVDCNKGESINSALKDISETLHIEIVGVCTEKVVVERDRVFLHGDPGGSGITAPASPPLDEQVADIQTAVEMEFFDNVALLIKNSRWFYIEDLLITSGENGWGAIRAVDSAVGIQNIQVVNEFGWGIIAEDSTVGIEVLDMRDNSGGGPSEAFGGIFVAKDSAVGIDGGTLTYGTHGAGLGENPLYGILVGSPLAKGGDPDPTCVTGGGELRMDNVNISAESSLFVNNASTADMAGGSLYGNVNVVGKSSLDIRYIHMDDTMEPIGIIWVGGGSNLSLNLCSLKGTLNIANKSVAIFRNATSWIGAPPDDPPFAYYAINVKWDSSLDMLGSSLINGTFRVSEGSRITMTNSTQEDTENPSNNNIIVNGSYIRAFEGPFNPVTPLLLNNIYLDEFSKAILDQTQINGITLGGFSKAILRNYTNIGWLNCFDGADVTCDDTVVVGSSNCSFCQ